MNYNNNFKKIQKISASIFIILIFLTMIINSSPVFAVPLSRFLTVGIVRVITFKTYTINKDNFKANIKVPALQGLNNISLESSLNKKYLAEAKELFNKFLKDIKQLPENSEAHILVSSDYEVKTDNDSILSLSRYVLSIAGSSNTVIKYDTIDKKKQILITLPSIFKNDSYIDVISANIITQMKEQMETQAGKIYWFQGSMNNNFVNPFKKISSDQSFYINRDNNLIISFNQAEVAPGFMGPIEFVIKTKDISNILLNNEYIK